MNEQSTYIYQIFKSMKATKKLFMAFLGVGLVMSSCNNEVIVESDNNQSDNQGNAFLSMALQFPEQSPSTYAVENGTADEQKVTTVDIVFFLSGVVDQVINIAPADFTKVNSQYTSKAMQLDKKDYEVVVLVNKPSALTIAAGTTKTDFEGEVTILASTLSAANNFYMTNATGYKAVYESNFQPTETAAKAAPVPLKVERGVAKVILTADPGSITVPSGVSVSNISWAVDMENKSMYWMRKQTNKRGGTTMEIEADYTDAGRQFLYAEDPNFTGHTDTDTVKFWKLSDAGNVSGAAEYVLENTMDSVDQFRNVTTSVMIKLTYNAGVPGATTIGFYTYNGMAISDADMKSYAATPSSIPNTLAGLGDLLVDLSTNESVNLTSTPSASFTYKHLSFYKNGICYYNVPIRHFEDPIGDMAYGKYGVVRNNVYKLTVNSISKPGKTTPDREDWEDDENDFISVLFEVTPWYIRSQVIDL